MTSFDFNGIGTGWHIDIYADLYEVKKGSLIKEINERVEQYDKAYSRFRNDSIITKASQTAGTYQLPDDATRMFDVYADLYARTGGFLTPLVGDALVNAGYDAEYSLKQKGKPTPAHKWEDAIEFVQPLASQAPQSGVSDLHPSLIVKKPTWIDLGAAGKGYLVDIIGELLESHGYKAYLINAGGDIRHRGAEIIKIGLENPDDFSQAIGVYNLYNKSICGSAGNRRKWGDFTHIIDPTTGKSPKEIVAVWVVTDTALIADALTTCLFFVPASTLRGAYSFEYMIIYKDKSFEKSAGFEAEIFS